MNEKIDYSKLTDSEIDELLATKIMGWFVDRDRIDKIPYYVSMQSGNVMPVEEWHPHDDLNQAQQVEEKVINNFIGILYGNARKRTVIHATARQRCVAILMTMEEE